MNRGTVGVEAALIVLLLGCLLLSGLPAVPGLVAAVRPSEGPPSSLSNDRCEPSFHDDGAGASPCAPLARPSSFEPDNFSSTLAWTQLDDHVPANVTGAGLASDSTLAEAVQFGGTSPSGLSNQTELYNETDNTWTFVSGGPGPSARTGLSLAGDPATGVAVLFGGETNLTSGSASNDTWVFQFSDRTWTNVSRAVGPAPRENAAFAIDPALGVGLLFGGWNPDYQGTGEVTFSDSWELNLSNDHWTRVSPGGHPGPPSLYGAMLDWDPVSGTFDLFGGCYPCSSNIWQFEPLTAEWAEAAPPGGTVPAARMAGVWAYDPTLTADVLFGGTDGVSAFADTSLFFPLLDAWSPQTASGVSARYSASATWLDVPGNETLLMTGGSAATLSFDGSWRLASTVTLSVQVVNASDQVPIDLASVDVAPLATQTTDAEGYANLSGLASEEISLNVTAAGYAANDRVFWPPPGTTTSLVVEMFGVAPSEVTVHVISTSGTPEPGSEVDLTIAGLLAVPGQTTDSFGWANFSNVPAAEGVVTASDLGDHSTTQEVLFASGEIVLVTLTLFPLTLLNLHVTGLLPNGTIAPLGNASVFLGGKLLGLTLGTGDGSFPTDDAGSQLLTVSAPYFASNTTSLDLPFTGAVPVTAQLRSAPAAILDLTVLDASTLLPVPVALINFTDASTLPVLPPKFSESTTRGLLLGPVLSGNYTLTAWAPGYEQNSTVAPQWLTPGQLDSLTVLLTPAPKSLLDTLILDNQTHTPIAGATVDLVGVATLTASAAGWANFTGLVAALFQIVASAPGYNSNQTSIFLGAGEVVPRFPINLTRSTLGSAPGGQNDLALLPPDAVSVWPLLLLPLAALAVAVVYLTMLRAPEAPAPPPPAEATASPEEPTGFWRRLRRTPPPPGAAGPSELPPR